MPGQAGAFALAVTPGNRPGNPPARAYDRYVKRSLMVMFKSVLVPLDGSDLAEQALGPARDLAVTLGSELLVLAAVEPLAVYPYQHPEAIGDVEQVQTTQARQYLDSVATELRTTGGPAVSTRAT